eukprot:1774803-Karenia_brevis.AAC.1
MGIFQKGSQKKKGPKRRKRRQFEGIQVKGSHGIVRFMLTPGAKFLGASGYWKMILTHIRGPP